MEVSLKNIFSEDKIRHKWLNTIYSSIYARKERFYWSI